MNRHTLTGIALAVTLAGCGANLALTPQELAAAQQGGNLEATYEQLAARLTTQNLNTPKGLQAQQQLNEIGAQLAGRLDREIRAEVSQHSSASGLVPRNVLDAQLNRLPKMERWNAELHGKLARDLNDLMGKTQARITTQQNLLAGLTETEMGQRLIVLDDLAKLTGDDRYNQERSATLANLRQKAEAAFKSEEYGTAKQALAALQQADPGDKALGSQILQADARLFEKKFWDSLSAGKVDEAYTQFMSLAQTPEFPEVLKRLNRSTTDMAEYFEAQAGSALAAGDLATTHKLLGQAQDIRSRIGSAPQRSATREAFVKALHDRQVAALKAGKSGTAYAYLRLIEQYDPDFPGLRGQLRTLHEQVLSKATKKVSTAAFHDAGSNSDFGRAVASRVTQHLFEKIPGDIRLIERDQFQAILREKELGTAGGTVNASDLASADYLIQGTILESRVDTTENRSKKTMRVVTDTVSGANPAHEQWAALPEAQRGKTPEPPRTLTQEKREDVTINLQIMRKVGILSASFRVVEASTGKVLATDSATAKIEHTDEGNEGIELGQFRMPFKLASLPADTEILQQLTEQISTTISDKLVKVLQNPEQRYLELATRHAEESDYATATENAAYALALTTQKQQDSAALRRQLADYTVRLP